MSGADRPLDLTYVLPLRWSQDGDLDELSWYLLATAGGVDELIVVDASEPALFDRHAVAFGSAVTHVAPHPDLNFEMGKVNGVVTGIREARNDRVVIADDDVRYSAQSLARVAAVLDHVELVRPQNYFEPLVWHARLDTARTLLNRVFSGDLEDPSADFPGTLGVRRSFFQAMGGYDGDALFENLELIRTVRAAGGEVASPLDLYVARRPPTTAHWRGQQVRQAYDDFALPVRMATWLTLAPLALIAAASRRWRGLLSAALASVALAEIGRRRARGGAVFPVSSSLLTPIWIAGRSISAWLALAARVRGGAPYGEGRLALAAHSQRQLRRRYEDRPLDWTERAPAEAEEQASPLSASKSMSL